MLRKMIGALMILAFVPPTVWAHDPANAEQAGNPPNWPLIMAVGALLYVVFLMIYVIRRQKYQKGLVDRSLKLSEDRNELARQQLALQAETNRLLERLIAERGQG